MEIKKKINAFQTPYKLKVKGKRKSIILFCNDTDMGYVQLPLDGNPFKNAAVISSGTKVSKPYNITVPSVPENVNRNCFLVDRFWYFKG